MQSLILNRLREKAWLRHLEVSRDAMSNPEIRRGSEAEYQQIAVEVKEALPPFGPTYETVQTFYESLPWPIPG